MLGILSGAFNTATRVYAKKTPLTQEQRHAEFLETKARKRRVLELERNRLLARHL